VRRVAVREADPELTRGRVDRRDRALVVVALVPAGAGTEAEGGRPADHLERRPGATLVVAVAEVDLRRQLRPARSEVERAPADVEAVHADRRAVGAGR